MPESEDAVYARIAKHNGTTVEQELERAKAQKSSPVAPGTEDIGDDPTASVHAYTGNSAAAASARPAQPGNPFTQALVTIYVISFALGVMLVGIGAANVASYDPTLFSDHTDNGVALIIWGGAFFNLGIVAAMVHLGAAAVLYRLHRPAAPQVATAP
ncbi:MAG: hypothetical protein JWQ39_601 [Glaciihabitans sp.]|nr:hypothetical protein [Glaciihabitans sp.]